MLKIRLQRVGRKHEPSFRLVLVDSKNSSKTGRFLEMLGSYDPRKITESFNIPRIEHWLSRGVLLTPSINNLLIKHKIIRGKKIDVSNVLKGSAEPAPEAVPTAETEAATQESAPEV
ncbi:MAG: 30S ribosomal protein S16 [bacterium]|nr:30S ribosomal protein S16 [bacterium]